MGCRYSIVNIKGEFCVFRSAFCVFDKVGDTRLQVFKADAFLVHGPYRVAQFINGLLGKGADCGKFVAQFFADIGKAEFQVVDAGNDKGELRTNVVVQVA